MFDSEKKALNIKSPIHSPITDGLLFWIDGRDGFTGTTAYKDGYSAGTITDRVSGAACPFTRAGNAYIVEDNDFFTFKNVSGTSVAQINSNSETLGIRTAEIIFCDYAMSDLYIGSSDRYCLRYPGNRAWWMYKSSIYTNSYPQITGLDSKKETTIQLVGTVSVDVASLYLNSDEDMFSAYFTPHETDRKYPNSLNWLSIVYAKSLNSAINSVYAKVASVRLYDRVLTPEEIEHNYNYEISTGRLIP